MRVREMMSRDFLVLKPGDCVADARRLLRSRQAMHLLVFQENTVVGVLAFRDLAGKRDEEKIDALMKREVALIDVNASLRNAASLMIRSTTGCLPVVENGAVTGIITTTELMKVLNTDSTLS